MKGHVEVFIVSRILAQNRKTFSPDDMIRFIQKEFKDERSGIKSHVTNVCVANAPLNHERGYNYLWRISHGEYRCFNPGTDQPSLERKKFNTQPQRIDVPEKYQFLLTQ